MLSSECSRTSRSGSGVQVEAVGRGVCSSRLWAGRQAGAWFTLTQQLCCGIFYLCTQKNMEDSCAAFRSPDACISRGWVRLKRGSERALWLSHKSAEGSSPAAVAGRKLTLGVGLGIEPSHCRMGHGYLDIARPITTPDPGLLVEQKRKGMVVENNINYRAV